MHLELLANYLRNQEVNRRDALGLAAKVGAVGAVSASVSTIGASTASGAPGTRGHLNDVPFDYSNLSAWIPGPYGRGDQRGSFNEVTEEKTAKALRTVLGARDVRTYNLGELMWNGFPAFQTSPRRIYEQRLSMGGYPPRAGFQAAGGIVQFLEPLGMNRLSGHEERFAAEQAQNHPVPLSTTYQIGTQLDNLNHIGYNEYFYNGFRGPEIDEAYGTTKLGGEHMGPVVTKGVLLDILGLKLAKKDRDAIGRPAANGKPVLASNYRITVEDIEEAMEFGRIKRIEPGDAVMFRTGWNQLLHRVNRQPNQADITRWSAAEGLPGIYLREARYLAQFRPSMVGSDTWALEVLGNEANSDGIVFPTHQDLIMRYGIRIAESVVLDGPANDRVHEFVYIVTPQFAEGSTCGNTPPAGLGRPSRRRDDDDA